MFSVIVNVDECVIICSGHNFTKFVIITSMYFYVLNYTSSFTSVIHPYCIFLISIHMKNCLTKFNLKVLYFKISTDFINNIVKFTQNVKLYNVLWY